MSYKEMALGAQLSGAYSCATTVMMYTAAVEAVHRVVHEVNKQSGDYRFDISKPAAIVTGNKTAKNELSPSSAALPLEGLNSTFWLARCDGIIEIRLVTEPDHVITYVSQKTPSLVTFLLQISHNRVVAGDSEGVLCVLDLLTLQECQRIQAHKATITCMAAIKSPTTHFTEERDNVFRTSFFITASMDSSIAIWDVVTLECIGRMKGKGAGFTAMTASVGGAFVFTGGEDGSLRMWSLIDNTQVIAKSGIKKKTVKKVKQKKEAASKSETVAAELLTKKKKQTLLSKEKEVGQPAKKSAIATRSSTAFCVGRSLLTNSAGTSQMTKTLQTIETSKRRTFLTPALRDKRTSLATKSTVKGVKTRFSASRTDTEVGCVSLTNRTTTSFSPNEDIYANFTSNIKSNKLKKNSDNDDYEVDEDDDDDEDDDVVGDGDGDEDNDNDDDDDNSDSNKCPVKNPMSSRTQGIAGEALTCGKNTASVNSGAGAMTSELNNTGKVIKKKKKQQTFDFATLHEQLIGNADEDSIFCEIHAKHFFDVGKKPDQKLLWPLLHEHFQAITALTLVRNRVLVTASRDGVAKMIALPSGRIIRTVQRGRNALTSLVFDEVRSLLWMSSSDGSIALYNMLHPDVVQVYCWRDVSTPYPRLVPLKSQLEFCQLYIFEKQISKGVLKKENNKADNIVSSTRSLRHVAPVVAKTSLETLKSCHNSVFESSPVTTLKCVQLNDGGSESTLPTTLLRSLDREFLKLQASYRDGSLRDAVFRRVLGRTVTPEGDEFKDFLCKEKKGVCTALNAGFSRLLLQRTYFWWLVWIKRHARRYRCTRKICFLTNVHQERLLGGYFGRWRQWSAFTRRLVQQVDMCSLERRTKNVVNDWLVEGNTDKKKIFLVELVKRFAGAKCRYLLQGYYFKWFFHVRKMRCIEAQSTAFNKLFLSFSDTRLSDAFFVWQHMTTTAVSRQRWRRAMWLLELRIAQEEHKRLGRYMKQWMNFVRAQREAHHSLILVEPLSSVLVNEESLLLRFFFKWNCFALSEAKLQRLEEEKTTMQREWMAVQNAVDSMATVAELQQEVETLETSIAQLAFERDEVDSKSATIASEVGVLHARKSLESLFAVYRDAGDSFQRLSEMGSVQRNRRSNSLRRLQASSSFVAEDTPFDDAVTMRQVGAVLGALKATAIRFGRHFSLISEAHKRVLRLPICEDQLGSTALGFGSSFCPTSGKSTTLQNLFGSSIKDGRSFAVQKRSPLSSRTSMTISLAEEFDYTTSRLQSIFMDIARLTGVDLSEAFTANRVTSVLEPDGGKSNGVATIFNSDLLRNLHLFPSNTRSELLSLIIDLIAMFDSVKAHSDIEIEGDGKRLSKRGIPLVMRLPLRSLCKPETAAWIIQNAAFLLEIMSPGTLQRYTKLRKFADDMAESTSSGVCGGSDAARFSPTLSVGTTISTHSHRVSQHMHSKNFMEELGVAQQRYGSQSLFCETRPQASQSHMSLSNLVPNTSRRRIVVPSSNSSTSRPQSTCDLKEYEHDMSRLMPQLLLPIPFSGASTPTKSEYSSVAGMRPYLGFRVAVCRNDAGNPTLTIHEVTESYLGGVGGVLRAGPAYAAGLRAGDQLVRFAGYTVTELAAFNAVVARHARPWKSIPVVFCRDGELMSANIVVGEKTRS